VERGRGGQGSRRRDLYHGRRGRKKREKQTSSRLPGWAFSGSGGRRGKRNVVVNRTPAPFSHSGELRGKGGGGKVSPASGGRFGGMGTPVREKKKKRKDVYSPSSHLILFLSQREKEGGTSILAFRHPRLFLGHLILVHNPRREERPPLLPHPSPFLGSEGKKKRKGESEEFGLRSLRSLA